MGGFGVVGELCNSELVSFLRTRGNSWVENGAASGKVHPFWA